jgi:hypothetical protein
MNTELIYSIEEVFTNCLFSHAADKFYIAPYQRGYKWGSFKTTDPVPVLLQDIKEAYGKSRSNKNKEYYLQYITVKENNYQGEKVLEVIDGQQRLTTISILLSAFHSLGLGENFSKAKLVYELRDNFLTHLYNPDSFFKIVEKDWDNEKGVVLDDSYINEQDVFYIFHACKYIISFLRKFNDEQLKSFYDYIIEYVKIIVNVVEQSVEGEKVFANLNSNKVYLTNAELIKGLVLTKVSREKDEHLTKKHFREILEHRASIGRKWDEICRLTNNAAFRKFFFDDTKSGIEHLLHLVATKLDGFKYLGGQNNEYELFNHFHSMISHNSQTVHKYFSKIKEVSEVLNEWYYHDDECHNLLGFIFFIKNSPYEKLEKKIELLVPLLEMNKSAVKEELKKIRNLLLDIDIDNLTKENDEELHRVFLALSVFDNVTESGYRQSNGNQRAVKFNFHSFDEDDWDIEHVFPSNPKQIPNELGQEDIENIKQLFDFKDSEFIWEKFKEPDDINEVATKQVYESVASILEKGEACKVSDRQKLLISKAISLLDIKDSIGNLCLLPAHINRSVGNGMFNKKRQTIIEKISRGHFVPIHTYNVFSKLLSSDMQNTLKVWTRRDMDEHKKFISKKIDLIINN